MEQSSAGPIARPAASPAANRRIVAAALELVPLIPFAVQFSALTPSDEVTPLWALAFTTGLGWVVARRWRTGVLIAALRVGILWAGIYALLITSFGSGCELADPVCEEGWQASLATPLLWGLGIFYVAAAVASAWLAQRVASRASNVEAH